ncbi:MAG: agmatine deiminase family protein [Candidatus Cloacimonetes bacterium]|nr:agmatine deiminase family protein [Candidatus Cloacimonadota bacterium]
MKIRVLLIFVMAAMALGLWAQSDNWEVENPIIGHYLSSEEALGNVAFTRNFTPTDPPAGDVRQTAEFDPMEGVLVVYPLGVPYELVAEMSQDATVYTVVSSSSQNSCNSNFQNHGVNMDNVVYINASTNSYWIRDYGPWFIMEDNSQIGIVDFPYNRPRPLDDEVPVIVANFLGVNLYGMNIEHTGGNYMCDGNGIGASTDLVWEENTNLSHDDINQMMQNYLGIDTYHVVPDPLGDYIKHIDCWGKFLDVDKVLIGQVPSSDPRYADYEAAADYFASQTSSYGTPFQVFRVYSPGDYWNATPYTNSLILNNKVFVPQTGNQFDDEALAVYETAMPGYEIIGVYSTEWLDTDALHCRTRGVADRGMLYIKHQPIVTEQPIGSDIQIDAEIYTLSGQALISDSLYVRYAVDGSPMETIPMTNIAGNSYSATIPAISAGNQVSYYIHAVDLSGRSMNHPFIGAADPHHFALSAGQAELVVTPLELTVSLTPNSTTSEIISLSNIGGMPLNYTIAESPLTDWLTESPDAGTIAAGETTDLTVTFDSTELTTGIYTCSLVISDDRREETTVSVTMNVSGSGVTSPQVPGHSALIHNYPNPFNPETTLTYYVAETAEVSLKIFNIKGELIKTLVDAHRAPGTYNVVWNGTDDAQTSVASGIYFARFSAGTSQSMKKLALMK